MTTINFVMYFVLCHYYMRIQFLHESKHLISPQKIIMRINLWEKQFSSRKYLRRPINNISRSMKQHHWNYQIWASFKIRFTAYSTKHYYHQNHIKLDRYMYGLNFKIRLLIMFHVNRSHYIINVYENIIF